MRRLALVLLATALVAGLMSAREAGATAGDGLLSILVMGDSYSAGNGAGHYYGAKGCRRSTRNYGREFQRLVEAAPYNQRAFVNTVACSGDQTSAFREKTHRRRPQLEAINDGYDLIFLTIGGNDLKFGKIVQYCLIARFRDGSNCGSLLHQAETKLTDGTIADRLEDVLKRIQGRAASTAKIVLLGYPYLEGDADYTLRSGHFGHTIIDVGKRLRHIQDLGDNVQRNIVAGLRRPGAPKLAFVNTKKLFEGPPNHELYAKRNNRARWFMQPFVDVGLRERDLFYHPNPTGWRQEAQLLLRDRRVPKHDPRQVLRAVIQEFPLGESSYPDGITIGPDNNIWVAESATGSGGSNLARLTPTGTVTEFPVPEGSDPSGLATGADGNLWFTAGASNTGDGIVRMTSTGDSTTFYTPREYTSPLAMTAGPDGNVWFSEVQVHNGQRIGRITPDGDITEYRLPSDDTYVEYMTRGPDGAIWFSETDANQIGRITLNGDITEFPVPTADSRPGGITTGPDGNLWFTEQSGNQIGRITPAGDIIEFPLPEEKTHPTGIVAGIDGDLWFTEWASSGSAIGRMSIAGTVLGEYDTPTPNSAPKQIISGPDGAIWFNEWGAGQVARLTLAP